MTTRISTQLTISATGSLSTAYTYDSGGNLSTATDAAGAVITYTYDSRHQLLTVVDSRSVTVTTNTYLNLGRVGTQQDGAGNVLRFAPADQGTAGNVVTATLTDAWGIEYRYANDGDLRLTQREVWQSGTLLQHTQFTYTVNGDIATMTDRADRLADDGLNNYSRICRQKYQSQCDDRTGGRGMADGSTPPD